MGKRKASDSPGKPKPSGDHHHKKHKHHKDEKKKAEKVKTERNGAARMEQQDYTKAFRDGLLSLKEVVKLRGEYKKSKPYVSTTWLE